MLPLLLRGGGVEGGWRLRAGLYAGRLGEKYGVDPGGTAKTDPERVGLSGKQRKTQTQAET